jgi:hypothetical protein
VSDGRAALRVGDRVLFEGCPVTVGGFSGTRVRLVDDAGGTQVLLLAHLLAAPGFELLEAGAPPARLDPVGLLDALPASVLAQARSWERHLVEVQTGLPPDPPIGARPREPYNPARHNLAERDAARRKQIVVASHRPRAGPDDLPDPSRGRERADRSNMSAVQRPREAAVGRIHGSTAATTEKDQFQ